MAKIVTLGLTAMQIGRLDKALEKLIRRDGVVRDWRGHIEAMPDMPEKEVIDGMIDYNRTTFNRLDGREQEAYMTRLKARRHYLIDNTIVPKIIFDAVPGRLVKHVDGVTA